MRILLTGASGGIGSAIKEILKDNELTCIDKAEIMTDEEFDWMIMAHGMLDEDELVETFMANVMSNIYLTQTVRAKNIIFISSTSALKGNNKYPIYSASKAALNMYAKCIADEQNVYVLCPGATDTPLFRKLNITDVKPQSPIDVAKAVELIMRGGYKSGDIIIIRNGITSKL